MYLVEKMTRSLFCEKILFRVDIGFKIYGLELKNIIDCSIKNLQHMIATNLKSD